MEALPDQGGRGTLASRPGSSCRRRRRPRRRPLRQRRPQPQPSSTSTSTCSTSKPPLPLPPWPGSTGTRGGCAPAFLRSPYPARFRSAGFESCSCSGVVSRSEYRFLLERLRNLSRPVFAADGSPALPDALRPVGLAGHDAPPGAGGWNGARGAGRHVARSDAWTWCVASLIPACFSLCC